MSLYQRRRKRPEMNLVPLIDVLVMLIFFAFVTMQFKSSATLNITLPKIETAGKSEMKSGTVVITVAKDGKLTFNGKVATDEQLLTLLQNVRSINRDIPVLISADKESMLGKAVFVMDICRKVGLNKFTLQGASGE